MQELSRRYFLGLDRLLQMVCVCVYVCVRCVRVCVCAVCVCVRAYRSRVCVCGLAFYRQPWFAKVQSGCGCVDLSPDGNTTTTRLESAVLYLSYKEILGPRLESGSNTLAGIALYSQCKISFDFRFLEEHMVRQSLIGLWLCCPLAGRQHDHDLLGICGSIHAI